jgi:hypothetical protein
LVVTHTSSDAVKPLKAVKRHVRDAGHDRPVELPRFFGKARVVQLAPPFVVTCSVVPSTPHDVADEHERNPNPVVVVNTADHVLPALVVRTMVSSFVPDVITIPKHVVDVGQERASRNFFVKAGGSSFSFQCAPPSDVSATSGRRLAVCPGIRHVDAAGQARA